MFAYDHDRDSSACKNLQKFAVGTAAQQNNALNQFAVNHGNGLFNLIVLVVVGVQNHIIVILFRNHSDGTDDIAKIGIIGSLGGRTRKDNQDIIEAVGRKAPGQLIWSIIQFFHNG